MATQAIKLTKAERELIIMENRVAYEKRHKLVVKILSWKFGLLAGALIEFDNKITMNEWNTYRRHILTISKIESKERVVGKLHDTHNAIKDHGGFA